MSSISAVPQNSRWNPAPVFSTSMTSRCLSLPPIATLDDAIEGTMLAVQHQLRLSGSYQKGRAPSPNLNGSFTVVGSKAHSVDRANYNLETCTPLSHLSGSVDYENEDEFPHVSRFPLSSERSTTSPPRLSNGRKAPASPTTNTLPIPERSASVSTVDIKPTTNEKENFSNRACSSSSSTSLEIVESAVISMPTDSRKRKRQAAPALETDRVLRPRKLLTALQPQISKRDTSISSFAPQEATSTKTPRASVSVAQTPQDDALKYPEGITCENNARSLKHPFAMTRKDIDDSLERHRATLGMVRRVKVAARRARR